MSENSEIWTRLNDHGQRIVKVESDIQTMAPKIHVSEQVGKLQSDVSSLRSVVEFSAKSTEQNVSKLANDISNIMSRLSALNEENMQRAAAAEKEKHVSQMALLEEQVKQAKQATEDSKFTNRVKNHWLPMLALVSAGAGIIGVVGGAVMWLLRQLL